MKYLLVVLIFTINGSTVLSQSEYPKSIINLGVGIGSHYGFIGIKSIIGYKNSGLLLGVGTVFGMTEFAIGGQISSRWWYLNIGYGPYGIIYGDSRDQKDVLRGVNVITGAMINLEKSKRVFIDVGLGFSWGAKPVKFFDKNINTNKLSGVVGIGIRIGKIKDKE